MRIPFDIKYRPQIESGEYRVETRGGLPARIICWDRRAKRHNDDDLNLCVLVPDDEGEAVYYYHRSGKRWVPNDDFDLFIVTPEEELTNFEKGLNTFLQDYVYTTVKEDAPEYIKKNSGVLLSLARKQLIEERYTSNPRKTDLYKLGKAEALKDLPRWTIYPHNAGDEPIVNGILQKDGSYAWRLYLNGYKIEISDLKKLPGFKED